MSRSTIPELDVDPFDEAVLADPVPTHAVIRETAPIVWIPARRIWMTGRDGVARDILTDPERFSSAMGVGLPNIRHERAWQKPSAILEVDPPDHRITRSVFNRILSPRAVAGLRDGFDAIAAQFVDDLLVRSAAGEIVDLATDLALRFPFTVLPDSVGLAVAGREHLLRYSAMYFNNRVPDSRLAAETADAGTASLPWVREQCRRENLSPDGFGAGMYAAVDRGEIDDETAATLVRTFLGGGIDTTVLVLGSLFHCLATHPEQWDRLRADPDLVRPAFEEALRLAPGAPWIGRTTTGPTEIGGVTIGAEQKVVSSLVAANRDPRRWERPDDFDIERGATGHLGFGLGPHFCVGHAIARLEAECVVTALADRVGTIEPAGEARYVLNNWLHGVEHLPVRLRAVG